MIFGDANGEDVPDGEPGEDAVTADELIEHVKGLIAPFKVPKTVTFVDELPRNQSGKLLERELRPGPVRGE